MKNTDKAIFQRLENELLETASFLYTNAKFIAKGDLKTKSGKCRFERMNEFYTQITSLTQDIKVAHEKHREAIKKAFKMDLVKLTIRHYEWENLEGINEGEEITNLEVVEILELKALEMRRCFNENGDEND